MSFPDSQGGAFDHGQFNNIAGNQYNNTYNSTYSTVNPSQTAFQLLWQAIADVGGSHNSEARYPQPRCHQETREEVRRRFTENIRQWKDSWFMYWLYGPPGAGKSAVAQSISEECHANGDLVSSFFLSRNHPKRNNPAYLFLTIAYGLACTVPKLQGPISFTIQMNPALLNSSIEEQFVELVAKPCRWLTQWEEWGNRPRLVVIDGLDECEGSHMQRRILSAIASSVREPEGLPLQFLISSRPEPAIREFFDTKVFHPLIQHYLLGNDLESSLAHRDTQKMSSDSELKRLEQTLEWTFEDKSRLQDFLAQKEQPAQQWLDSMQQLADSPNISSEMRPSLFTAMLRLSKNSGLHPQCLAIQNVKKFGEYPIDAGGFGEVWKGVIGDSSLHVCLKVVKIYQGSDIEKLSKECLREAILWRQTKHPHVLPFLGIYQLENSRQLCLISPWMDKGNLVQYLKATRQEDVDHNILAHDVAAGLSHLHLLNIVHSDLKGVNILITDALRACIADFGLSRVRDAQGLKITSSNSRSRGTGRWLAPELLLGCGAISSESDMYAYGCVCYEIFTGQHPFPELPHEAAVVLAVSSGKHPLRPEGTTPLTDAMWALMQSCWDPTPASRPTASQVVDKILSMDTPKSICPAPEWNESTFTQVWGNINYPAPAIPSLNSPQHENIPTQADDRY